MRRRDDALELTPELMLRAYAAGIFPMAESRHTDEVFWVDPKRRGILPIDDVHVPRRLARTLRGDTFTITCNQHFEKVVRTCAESTARRKDTWINPPIEKAVNELHAMGFAHSIEAWRDGALVGGLYGISLGAAFFGESMFSRDRDASKIALIHLVARLRLCGFRLLDTQFVTDHLAQFGVVEVAARDYLVMLEEALKFQAGFPADADADAVREALAETIEAGAGN